MTLAHAVATAITIKDSGLGALLLAVFAEDLASWK